MATDEMRLGAPPPDWKSPLHVFESSCEHEQKVTALINALYAQAQKEPNHVTLVLMQRFISEQMEEEKSTKLIVDQLKLAGGQREMELTPASK